MNSHVHCSIVQKSQDMKTTQVSKTDEQILKLWGYMYIEHIYTYNLTFFICSYIYNI